MTDGVVDGVVGFAGKPDDEEAEGNDAGLFGVAHGGEVLFDGGLLVDAVEDFLIARLEAVHDGVASGVFHRLHQLAVDFVDAGFGDPADAFVQPAAHEGVAEFESIGFGDGEVGVEEAEVFGAVAAVEEVDFVDDAGDFATADFGVHGLLSAEGAAVGAATRLLDGEHLAADAEEEGALIGPEVEGIPVGEGFCVEVFDFGAWWAVDVFAALFDDGCGCAGDGFTCCDAAEDVAEGLFAFALYADVGEARVEHFVREDGGVNVSHDDEGVGAALAQEADDATDASQGGCEGRDGEHACVGACDAIDDLFV